MWALLRQATAASIAVGGFVLACSSSYSAADGSSNAGSKGGVYCPTTPTATRCTGSGQVCCGVPTSAAFRRSYDCRAAADCVPSAIAFPCSSASDCPGTDQVCCATLDTSNVLQSVACMSAAKCPADTISARTEYQNICDPTAPVCGPGLACKADPHQSNVGLSYCVAQ